MRNSTKLLLVLAFLISTTVFFIIGAFRQQSKVSISDELLAEQLDEHSPFVGVTVKVKETKNPTIRKQFRPKAEFKTGFPGFSGKTEVLCGGHTASSCSECPQGHGAGWCNGECEWISGNCTRNSKLQYIHPDYFKIIERYAFQPVMTEKGEYVNVIMVRAPFRVTDDEDLYNFYKDDILFLGISSFESYPLKSCNPYSGGYESDYYLKMFPGFLHMMHQPEEHFPKEVKTLLMSQSDFMLDDAKKFGERQKNVEKIYDFVYSGGDQVSSGTAYDCLLELHRS